VYRIRSHIIYDVILRNSEGHWRFSTLKNLREGHFYKNFSEDEIPECDVTCIILSVYSLTLIDKPVNKRGRGTSDLDSASQRQFCLLPLHGPWPLRGLDTLWLLLWQ